MIKYMSTWYIVYFLLLIALETVRLFLVNREDQKTLRVPLYYVHHMRKKIF